MSLCHSVTAIAHAQSAALSLSPPVVEILIAPSKQVTETFTLKANGQDLSIIPQLHRVIPADENGHANIDPNPLNPDSIPLLVKLEGAKFGEPLDLKGGRANLTLSLEAAALEETTDIYLALVLKAVSTGSPLSSWATSPAISALILATIAPSGIIPIDLQLERFSPPFFHDSWSPLTITPSLKNNTGTMIRPEGKYEIFSPSGQEVLSLPLYPALVLGKSSRLLKSNISNLASDLTWSPSWTNIGPYRLRLTITTTGGTKLTEVEKVIWILPIRLFFILVAIAFLIFTLTLVSKHTKFKIR